MNNNHIPSNNIFVSLSQTSPLIITGKELKNNKTTDTGGDDNMIVTDRLTDTEPTLSDSPAAVSVDCSTRCCTGAGPAGWWPGVTSFNHWSHAVMDR